MLEWVSTHSRLKAADKAFQVIWVDILVSTHSRLKAAASALACNAIATDVSTHSRLKAAEAFNFTPIT